MKSLESLFDTRTLVFDGGIGTELYERGFYINRPFEELNTAHPKDVQAVHEAYIQAGAQVITTNSFSLPSPQLEKFDIIHRQAELLHAALEQANKARQNHPEKDIKIALSFGPMGQLIEPLGRMSKAEVTAEYRQLALHAAQQKFDLYILETFSNLDELDAAIQGLRSVDTDRPILASITARSSEVALIQLFAARMEHRTDVQALGLNCSEGPHDLLQGLKVLKPLTTKPIIIQPNAGIPRNINGRYFYMTSPDYLAKFAKRFIEAGAYGVGGCCGTGPDHIRAIAQSVKMMEARSSSEKLNDKINDHSAIQDLSELEFEPVPWQTRTRSKIGEKIKNKQKVITVELTSPKGTDLAKFLVALKKLREAGVEFVNVPDGARASTRVSSLHIATYVNSRPEWGMTIIPHLTTRDRNLIALQSDLLGASINGVHDVLLITGDPPKLGSNKDTTAVYDIDSIGLTYLVNRLNHANSVTGDELGSGTEFGVGVASNPTAINLELELKRWNYKVESGCDFAVTQPIFDAETYLNWKKQIQDQYRPHILGIWPFISFKNAEFMAHEVPGVFVPQWALDKMASVQNDPAASIEMGIEIAAKVIRDTWNDCEGYAISAPLGKVDVVLEVLKEVKQCNR
jgi:methionine synthase I (cobalamin-dependent)/5,10-methylenetetrahydrofolate reductase